MLEQISEGFGKLNPCLDKGKEAQAVKSKDIISSESQRLITDVLVEEFGEDQIVSIGLFGSRARGREIDNSDFDFIVIVQGLPADIHKREDISPRIKKRLSERNVAELCAFNLYTPLEFTNASLNKSWLIETMKNGYVVYLDKNAFLSSILNHRADVITKKGDFVWQGVATEDESHISSVITRHVMCAILLEEDYPPLSDYHKKEAFRGAVLKILNKREIIASRGSLKELSEMAFPDLDDNSAIKQSIDTIDLTADDLTYDDDKIDQYLQASFILEGNGLLLDALFYSCASLKSKQVSILKRHNVNIPNSEINQLFLRKFQKFLTADLIDGLYTSAFKAEQILGRSQYFSFDLDEEGKPIFEDINSGFNYRELLKSIRELSAKIDTNLQIDP